MRLIKLRIRNFKSIRDMLLQDLENVLILVGKNNTGKTAVLDAVRAVGGTYRVKPEDFNEKKQNIEINVSLKLTEEDLRQLHGNGTVSAYKRFELWKRDFLQKLPSCRDGVLDFTLVINSGGQSRYQDGVHKNNKYIPQLFPKLYYIDTLREISEFQSDLLFFQEDETLKQMRGNRCMFDAAKRCNHCFQCIGLIARKQADELNVFETARLLEYKIYRTNLSGFERKVNDCFAANGGYQERIAFSIDCDLDQLCRIRVEAVHRQRGTAVPVEQLSKGMRSIYILSLLEAYMDTGSPVPGIIMIEDPESFLHPKLQKNASEILYRLSRKNQVIFTTHSPAMLFNFTGGEIRQVVPDKEFYSVVRERTDLDAILDDLGYSAGDLMDVSFVFIVEGKQDKSRLPLLLERYFSEIRGEDGTLRRIAIVTTNSCTNIKTYANLKYINQLYLRDQFLMIRDGDGEDREKLAGQLCRYYEDRNREETDKLPRVRRENVLILRYYSFENYFLNPAVMARLGVVESEEAFYRTLYEKWREYLYRLRSGRHLTEVMGRDFTSPQDMREHMEEIRTYLRGHNLFDLFYGRYREQETELLEKYIQIAPREDFADILDAVESFTFFESRKLTGKNEKSVFS